MILPNLPHCPGLPHCPQRILLAFVCRKKRLAEWRAEKVQQWHMCQRHDAASRTSATGIESGCFSSDKQRLAASLQAPSLIQLYWHAYRSSCCWCLISCETVLCTALQNAKDLEEKAAHFNPNDDPMIEVGHFCQQQLHCHYYLH